MVSRPLLRPGTDVRYGGREWTVVGIEACSVSGARIWLSGTEMKDGQDALAVFGLAKLLGDASFEPVGGPPRLRVPQMGLLSTVSEGEQWRAFELERHVREVETGRPTPDGTTPVRPEYDPASTTLAQREQAKADELAAQGWADVSRATVRRWRARYRADGVWGLVKKRRSSAQLARADARVVEALRVLLPVEASRSRSRGWKKRMRGEVQWWLDDHHGGPGQRTVEVPPQSTFNRLLDTVGAIE